jgi:hypothetical protein
MFVAGFAPPDCWGKIWPNVKFVENVSATSQSDLVMTFMDGPTVGDETCKVNGGSSEDER